jgi:hypothetical protein
MELNKERGPIYSRYDRDRSDNYKVVIDYAAPRRSREETEFMTAHNMPSNDIMPGSSWGSARRVSQSSSAAGSAFMQSMLAQRAANQVASDQSMAKQDISWAGQHGRTPRTDAQRKMAMIGVVIWAIFILLALLMSMFGK